MVAKEIFLPMFTCFKKAILRMLPFFTSVILFHFSGRTHLHPSVFPLLLLLSHLYSSSMDGNDSKMKLSAFVPHIIRFEVNYSKI